MAAQSGWYAAPGEQGMLRWWTGGSWTEDRQPVPQMPPVPPMPALAMPYSPTPEQAALAGRPAFEQLLGEFHQFAAEGGNSRTINEFINTPKMQDLEGQTAGRVGPILNAIKGVVTGAGFLVIGYITASVGAHSPVPNFSSPPITLVFWAFPLIGALVLVNSLVTLVRSRRSIVAGATMLRDDVISSHKQAFAESTVAVAAAAPAQTWATSPTRSTGRFITLGRGMTTTRGAITGMVVALVFVVAGLALTFSSVAGATVGASETKTTGVVASQGWDNGLSSDGRSCFPVATYVVAGLQYTAHSSTGTSPCPVQVGQSVDVIYTTASPADSGRIPVSGALSLVPLVFSLLGGLLFVVTVRALVRARRSA